ncbi:hypothetical protein H1P_1550004 [Hyella patelloides LEGE 07179]|uniref:Uncharacterized protein n=1 Tax=Hyella patelloides LEGE 07179 TaxID=945734 RepID=A0A563VMD3_9CYAN|nr:hypothetical protein H1P_1550004 [Hyella patelloides LEGE 07179]
MPAFSKLIFYQLNLVRDYSAVKRTGLINSQNAIQETAPPKPALTVGQFDYSLTCKTVVKNQKTHKILNSV